MTAIAFVLALHLDRVDHCHIAIGLFVFNPYHFSDHEFLMDLLVDWYGRTSQEDVPRCLPIFIARRTEWSRGIHIANVRIRRYVAALYITLACHGPNKGPSSTFSRALRA